MKLVDPHTVDLCGICQSVVAEARICHPDRAIEMVIDGDSTGAWDGARMAQAMSNLISNAVEHGRLATVIKVSLHGFPDEVILEVRNQADVISPSRLRILFDPVKRPAIGPASEPAASRMPERGSGLYLVKQIVAAHQGQVSISSNEDDGVVFSARLPRLMEARRSISNRPQSAPAH